MDEGKGDGAEMAHLKKHFKEPPEYNKLAGSRPKTQVQKTNVGHPPR